MSSVSTRQNDGVSSLWIFYSSRWDGFYNGLKNDDLKYQTLTNVLYTGLIMKLNCTITQVQCSQKVINIITIIIKTKHHLLTNGVGQRDWWERDADYETLLFVSFIACFVYGPAPVLLFVMKISFCDNESVLNRIKIASDPHNVNLPLKSSLGPHTMNREISSNHKRWHQFSFHPIANKVLGPWKIELIRKWETRQRMLNGWKWCVLGCSSSNSAFWWK